MKEIEYAFAGAHTGGAVVPGGTTSLTSPAEGLTTLTYFARDSAGNQGTPKTLTVRIDKTPPSPPTAGVSPVPDANGWNNTASVTVSFGSNGGAGPVQSGAVTCTGPTTLTTEASGAVVDGTCTAAAGNSSASTAVTVKIDRTPPTLACSVSPQTLWPPNERLVPVQASVYLVDALSGSAGFTLVSVRSSERSKGWRHHDRSHDIRGFVIGTPDTSGLLRAERAEHGAKRVYTLTYRGLDLAGNAETCSVMVTVPHDRREHDGKDDDRREHDRKENDWREHEREGEDRRGEHPRK